MPIKNTIKTASVFATAIVCGIVSFNSDALAGQQSGVIQLQPQTGATIQKAAAQTVSRVRRQSFVPSAQALPQVSAEPIAPPSVPRVSAPAIKPVAAKQAPPRKAQPRQATKISTAKTSHTNTSAIVNNDDSSIRTTVESPKFVNINKPALVKVKLENTGKTPVGQVEFLVALPESTKLASATPEPTMAEGRLLQFNLKALNANETRQIILNVVPTERTQIDIVTSVRTETQQNVLVAVREPQLEASINGPSQTNLGENVTHEIVITNTGDGVATQVNVQPQFPANLVQTKQSQSNLIPKIEPGKSAKLVYHSQAITPGPVEIKAAVSSDDGVEPRSANLAMTIFEPPLEVSAIGPKVNFVDRNGIYTINLENKGKVLSLIHI